MLTDAELAAIREREQLATKGPWCIDWVSWGIRHLNRNCDFDECPKHGGDCYLHPQRDMGDYNFIAHARADIPNLLQTIDELKGEIERLKNDHV